MKIIQTIFYGFFVLLLLSVTGLFLLPLLPISNNIQIKIVESGSMEPTILTGSLVVVRPSEDYTKGDIITFKSAFASIPTTHRIVAVRDTDGEKFFTTKGDANEDADSAETQEESVVGKVAFAVPYVGFMFDFARQPLGFTLLIVLPACLIIIAEIEKIWLETRKQKVKKSGVKSTDVSSESSKRVSEEKITPVMRMMEIACPVYVQSAVVPVQAFSLGATQTPVTSNFAKDFALPVAVVLASVLFSASAFVGNTMSYFNDSESSLGNFLRASALDFIVQTDGSSYTFLGTDLVDSDGVVVTIVTPEKGSADIQYTVSAEKITGSDLFCGALHASTSVPILYNGSLLGLTAEGVTFTNPWEMSLSLPSDIIGLLPNEGCVIDVVYTAWNSKGKTGVGYFDVERVRLEFYAPGVAAVPIARLLQPLFSSTTLETRSATSSVDTLVVPDQATTTEDVVVPVQEAVVEEVVTEPEAFNGVHEQNSEPEVLVDEPLLNQTQENQVPAPVPEETF